jgi:hypothetical protein
MHYILLYTGNDVLKHLAQEVDLHFTESNCGSNQTHRSRPLTNEFLSLSLKLGDSPRFVSPERDLQLV